MELGKKRLIILIGGTIILSLIIALFIFDNDYMIYLSPPVENDIPLSRGVQAEYKSEIFEIAEAIGAGWNLGNALDSTDRLKRETFMRNITREEHYETFWGNPVTTPEMITSIAKMGFGAVRVPVTYHDHLDDDFMIQPGWLERVEQVVNYVLDNNIYCIINLHHDTGNSSWLRADADNIGQIETYLSIVWSQIAEHFKDYGDKLIFESFNEIRDVQGRWGNAGREAYEAVNRLNQVFVNTVRGTGGNNALRYLIVKPYAAGTDADILDAFRLPEDSIEARLIVSAHYYGPLPFSWRQEDVHWTTAYSDWSRRRDGVPVENAMKRLGDAFTNKGISVIIGEFGAHNKNNTADRISYAVHYVETAKKYGIICFWWDDGGQQANAESVRNYALFDRSRNKWFFPEIAEAIINAAK